MKGKANLVQTSGTPGPGAYMSPDAGTNRFNKSPNYGFGGASRDGIRPGSAPGPGQYQPANPNYGNAAKYGFGTSDRVGIKNRHDLPGPASYQIPAKMGYEGPKYSGAGRRNAAGYNNTPGPGAYQPDDSNASTWNRPQKWGFGTSPREGRSTLGTPGPGSYDRNSGIKDGPKFSMKARNDVSPRVPTPGPGEHGGVYTQFGAGQ